MLGRGRSNGALRTDGTSAGCGGGSRSAATRRPGARVLRVLHRGLVTASETGLRGAGGVQRRAADTAKGTAHDKGWAGSERRTGGQQSGLQRHEVAEALDAESTSTKTHGAGDGGTCDSSQVLRFQQVPTDARDVAGGERRTVSPQQLRGSCPGEGARRGRTCSP